MAARKYLVELKHHYAYNDVTGRLDPHSLYVARAREHHASLSRGIERFARSIFGSDLISSLAFALDVTAKFEFSRDLISPTNRTRKFTCIRQMPRTVHRYRVSRLEQNQVTCIGGTRDQGRRDTSTTLDFGTGTLNAQAATQGFVSDSTRRTRTLTQRFGEFELFAHALHAPVRHHAYTDVNRSYADTCGLTQYVVTHITDYTDFTGPGATVTPSEITTLKTSENTNALALFSKHVGGLLAKALPDHRSQAIFYNLAELKDTPQLLRGSVQAIQIALNAFKGHFPRGANVTSLAGNQYLNYKFGWEQLVQSVRSMVELPALVAQRVNYLIERNGKATTSRSSMRIEDALASSPGFDYNTTNGEFIVTNGKISRRTIDLKCVINSTINFPKASVPILRRDILDTVVGANPDPTDLYNLIPWTWLIDWYTGLGEYINVINDVNTDRALVNYGFLTYKSKGEITGSLVTESTEFQSYSSSPPLTSQTTSSKKRFRYSPRLTYRYQLRKDIGTLSGVKTIGRESTLTPSQSAIIGALFAKFTS